MVSLPSSSFIYIRYIRGAYKKSYQPYRKTHHLASKLILIMFIIILRSQYLINITSHHTPKCNHNCHSQLLQQTFPLSFFSHTCTHLFRWIVDLDGAEESLYDGEHFQLQFIFSPGYPFESPEVTFIGPNIPVHPHVYSNGHICLSILTEDWSPALSVQSVCLSIVSMLSSCREKRRPPDNALYVRTCSKNPKKTKWWYHDDSVQLNYCI